MGDGTTAPRNSHDSVYGDNPKELNQKQLIVGSKCPFRVRGASVGLATVHIEDLEVSGAVQDLRSPVHADR